MPRMLGPNGPLWLSYCSNVLPCARLDDLLHATRTVWAEVRRRLGLRGPLGLGLWLPASIVTQLHADAGALDALRRALAREQLACIGLNAFPYGDFHGERVKDAVYRPAWFEPARLDYTIAAANVLARLLPEDQPGGCLSTLPLAWRAHAEQAGGQAFLAGAMLLEAAGAMGEIERRSGKHIRIALEPEPGCVIERSEEALRFFLALCRGHRRSAEFDRHLGLCFDCCHQAVLGEPIAASLERLHTSGITVAKLHLSAAVEGPIEALRPYAEPRYLHQTVAVDGGARADDLETALADPRFRGARVRAHVHVPIHAATLAPGVRTTRAAIDEALATVLRWRTPPQLEVETYTWNVLPERPRELARAIAGELRYALERLRSHGYEPQ